MNKMLMTLGCLLLAACSEPEAPESRDGASAVPAEPVPEPRLPLPEREAPFKVRVYDCEGERVVLELRDGGGWLFAPGLSLEMQAEPAASGVRMSGEGGVFFWSKGQEARLETPTGRRHCREQVAEAPWEQSKLSGMDFRAVGNEPGWVLEIQGNRLLLVTDYGNTRIEDSAEVREFGDQSLFKGQRLDVTLAPGPCVDDMSGQRFETKVTIRLAGQAMKGCGRPLH
ncbi:MliC family protein [Gallaecimonas sp. GXIMD4217]|uniref:COG3650 family protein n=1 Tax=Gallaecimonas sp. GXIMD4217 TaxID=3131927 RepID=UPI00311ADFDA